MPMRGRSPLLRLLAHLALLLALLLALPAAQATMGARLLPADDFSGPVMLLYPSAAPETARDFGTFHVTAAWGGTPLRGNGRLVVVSHGSGGSWLVHTDLARALVDAGFTVALPEHRGDNWHDSGNTGPVSFELRPREVSHAIDRVAADPALAPLLALDRVGMYGMSAGGHTALALAGGRWSATAMRDHCLRHDSDDFQACAATISRLRGDAFDGLRRWLMRSVVSWKFTDPTPHGHTDARIAAIVAAVPYASDFDLATLKAPPVPLGLAVAGHDAWLVPRFHAEAVLAACAACERVVDLPAGGHGAYLSPLPPQLHGVAAELLADPPGFDRAALPAADRRIAAFFRRHLLP